MVRTVLRHGELVTGRNGEIAQYFSPAPIVIQSVDNTFPILQIRKVPFYKAALETLFFLSGESSYESMPECLRNSWWKPWSAQAKENNSWGKFYGHQMRHSQAGIGEYDQWAELLNSIQYSLETGEVNRRLVISLWRAQDTLAEYCNDPAVLPSCHSTALVFNLNPDTRVLDLHHTQRSLDLMCGFASDLIYSGLLLKIIADEYGLKCGKLVFQPINCHIYSPHFEEAGRLTTVPLPKLSDVTVDVIERIDFKAKTIEDVKSIFKLSNYNPLQDEYKFELVG
jgi:thymidylate synthase